ncbi:hypothetical protein QCA50_012587 [Cerrena zonata]|uniref:Uncharacterized protein n=1 Tax=Cerrena zonata TaxID=2478898 RepID=A0AAW0FRJ6_9APHY
MPKSQTPHIAFTSSSLYPTSGRKHTYEYGYERCAHNCKAVQCRSKSRGTLWLKEGNALARHMRNMTVHKGCSPACKAYGFMTKKPDHPLSMLKDDLVPTTEDYDCTLSMNLSPVIRKEINQFLKSAAYEGGTPNLILVSDNDDTHLSPTAFTPEVHLTPSPEVQALPSPSASPCDVINRSHDETSDLVDALRHVGMEDMVSRSENPTSNGEEIYLHYVPDPNMSGSPSEMCNHLNYQRETLDDEELQLISAASKHYYVVVKRPNRSRVIIDQWLFLMLCLRRQFPGRFRLKVTPWSEFLHWIMSLEKVEDYRTWRKYDLVLGVVDYSTEYIRESTGITITTAADFDERMQILTNYTTIWPPINLIKMAACKFSTIVKLDDIAARVTKTARPSTSLWDRKSIPGGKVLKRCYSSYQEDVYLPDGSSTAMPTVEALLANSTLPGRHWLVQDWVSHLRQAGELKVYFVNMEVVYIAATRYSNIKEGWEFSINPPLPTLSEIQYVLYQPLCKWH